MRGGKGSGKNVKMLLAFLTPNSVNAWRALPLVGREGSWLLLSYHVTEIYDMSRSGAPL